MCLKAQVEKEAQETIQEEAQETIQAYQYIR